MDNLHGQLISLLPRLRRFAFTLTGSMDDAEDLLQAACEKALKSLDRFEKGTRMDSWMYRIIQNCWIDQVRARKVRGPAVEMEIAERVAGSDARQETEARLTLQRVQEKVAELPEEQRVLIAMVSVEGLSYKEAATALDIPIGTVMSRLARGRRRLHELLELSGPAAGVAGAAGD